MLIRVVDHLFFFALICTIGLAAITAFEGIIFPAEGGARRLFHMYASGALVFVLPLFALYWLFRCLNSAASGGVQRLGFWLLIITGTLTIATVFVCMLPVPSTEQMEQLIELHGYAGFAMVPALLLVVIGEYLYRRIQATRSATPG
jgi:flagellar biogenesis protein FliO